MSSTIAEAFLKNRAELLPEDVWERYIVPPFFRRIPAFKERKSLRIQGGRGCGKTMFLRYLCHPTRFSAKRRLVPIEEFSQIGLFWRPDTQFCALMRESWLGEQEAQAAFNHYSTLVVLSELSRSFDSIAKATIDGGPCDLRQLELPHTVQLYLNNQASTIDSLKEFSLIERAKLELWLQNPETRERPLMLRFDSILEQLASFISTRDERLSDVFFRVFVDEFENLQEYQRRLIADKIKHPNKWFNVCFSMRKSAVTQFFTSGQEQIAENHDLFTIDIEDLLREKDGKDFQLIAAEFLLQGVSRGGRQIDSPEFNLEKLVDESAVLERSSDSYRQAIISIAQQIFPRLSAKDISQQAINDPSLRRRLLDMIQKGLNLHRDTESIPEEFILEGNPEASIVSGALVNRKRPGSRSILEKIKRLEHSNDKSDFENLINNNLHGCLFYLYIGLPRRPNLLYSGFDRFCMLSASNLRFFQQLCYFSFTLAEEYDASLLNQDVSNIRISHSIQAQAAEQASEIALLEVERLGTCGPQLLEIITRLGKLFAAAQRRPSQSEVEINHFSIDDSDKIELTAESKELLRQAEIWSIFYKERYTKNKSDYDLAQTDIIPNPNFSPYFRISYRKKKKITLSGSQVNLLLTGTGEQFESILNEYRNRWNTGDQDTSINVTPGLF